MATEHGTLDLSFPAAGDIGARQFYAVQMLTTGQINTISTTATAAFGVLQDDPDSAGAACAVRLLGTSKLWVDPAGGTINPGDRLGVGTDGLGVVTTLANRELIGRALESLSGTPGIISVLIERARL